MTPDSRSGEARMLAAVIYGYALVLAMRSLGPALALGNSVVLKSDPNTPVTGGVVIARLPLVEERAPGAGEDAASMSASSSTSSGQLPPSSSTSASARVRRELQGCR